MNTEERVELHCHSKFSGNAVMYAGEIIRHLSERSMPAVAITDTSNILAFPEEEHVMSTGNYSTRPIFAMEALIDSDNTKVTILVKNETGKKNIIKLVSNAEDEAFPVFEIKEILKNREGLLLGSGACRAHKKADRACRLHG